MTILIGVCLGVLLVLVVVLLVVVRRLQDAEYWRDYWCRRHSGAAQDVTTHLDELASVEQALRTLWPCGEVVTPEVGAAVAVLRAVFPNLPVPPGPRLVVPVSGESPFGQDPAKRGASS